MKVLVTGAYGFLGRHVCDALLEQGLEVVGVDRVAHAISPKAERIKGARFPFVEIDLCDYKRLFSQVKKIAPDAIVHIAAQYSVSYTTEHLHSYIRSNLAGVCYVLEAAKLARVRRVIYASSIAVSDSRTPRGLYAATKGFAEEAAHAYSNRGIVATGLRYGVIYGPMLRSDTGIYRVLEAQLTGRPRYRPSRNTNPYVEVSDAARITAKLVTYQPRLSHEVYPVIANDAPANLGHVAIAAALYLGRRPVLPKNYDPGARGPIKRSADIERLVDAIGDYPATTLESGIGNTMSWLRSTRSASAK